MSNFLLSLNKNDIRKLLRGEELSISTKEDKITVVFFGDTIDPEMKRRYIDALN